MGQSITVESKQLGDFCVFTTDRSITGQDGSVFSSAAAAESEDDFPAVLATRLFASDDGIEHIYVASNDVVVRRTPSWDTNQVAAASQVIEELFRFYPD
jgi:hypothetical protein